MRSRQQKEEVKAREETQAKDAQEEKHLPEKDLVSFSTQNEVARKETSVLLSTKEKTKETETVVPRGDAEVNAVERETKEPANLTKERAQALE
jgi:hypothetical protein